MTICLFAFYEMLCLAFRKLLCLNETQRIFCLLASSLVRLPCVPTHRSKDRYINLLNKETWKACVKSVVNANLLIKIILQSKDGRTGDTERVREADVRI